MYSNFQVYSNVNNDISNMLNFKISIRTIEGKCIPREIPSLAAPSEGWNKNVRPSLLQSNQTGLIGQLSKNKTEQGGTSNLFLDYCMRLWKNLSQMKFLS